MATNGNIKAWWDSGFCRTTKSNQTNVAWFFWFGGFFVPFLFHVAWQQVRFHFPEMEHTRIHSLRLCRDTQRLTHFELLSFSFLFPRTLADHWLLPTPNCAHNLMSNLLKSTHNAMHWIKRNGINPWAYKRNQRNNSRKRESNLRLNAMHVPCALLSPLCRLNERSKKRKG